MTDRYRPIHLLGLLSLGAAGLLMVATVGLSSPAAGARPAHIERLPVTPGPASSIAGANAARAASVVPTATGATSSGESAAVGLALFQAKGCVTCHRHTAIAEPGQVTSYGPDLSRYRGDPGLLRRRLADPASFPPTSTLTFPMPNLNLSPVEIEALIAFLNTPPQQ